MQSKNASALKRALSGSAKRGLPSPAKAAASRRRQAVRAIRAKDAAAIERLLASGMSPNLCVEQDPLLRLAVAADFAAGVRALLAAGADPEAFLPPYSIDGGPLSVSAALGSTECLELLLSAGADPDGGPSAFGYPRMPPAIQAVASANWRALRLLGGAGADMGKVAFQGHDVLSHAVSSALGQGDASGVRICLEFGADPDRLTGPLRETAPMMALRQSRAASMRVLCEHGFDPSLGNDRESVAEAAVARRARPPTCFGHGCSPGRSPRRWRGRRVWAWIHPPSRGCESERRCLEPAPG